MAQIKPGAWRHFKGHEIRVIGEGKHTETLEDYVYYEHLGENDTAKFWLRPKVMFLETVTRDGQTLPRFTYVGEV